MPLENRVRLIELCAKYNIVIIEDDTLGTLRYEKLIPTLKSLSPEEVIYISSFSKVLSPGYRVGWVAGGKYADSIELVQGIETTSISLANHLTIAQYIESGKLKAYFANIRKIYSENCNLMADAIEKYFPEGTSVFRPKGGQYLWVEMPKKCSSTALFFAAQKCNILLAPGSMFTKSGDFENYLRFCYAMEITPQIMNAIETVGTLAKELLLE